MSDTPMREERPEHHAHGERRMRRLGWDDDWGVNGVLPGGGRCAACHVFTSENYLLCKPCWNRLPAADAADLTALWNEIARRKAGTIGEIRDRQRAALDSIEHVPPTFCPYCPFDGQEGADIFRRLRPDACVSDLAA